MTATTRVMIALWHERWHRLVRGVARVWVHRRPTLWAHLARRARCLAPRSLRGLATWLAVDALVLAAAAWGLIGLSRGADAAARLDYRALAVVTAAPRLPAEIQNPRAANGFAAALVRPVTAASQPTPTEPTARPDVTATTTTAPPVARLMSPQPTTTATGAPVTVVDVPNELGAIAAGAALDTAPRRVLEITSTLPQPTVEPVTATPASVDPTLTTTATETTQSLVTDTAPPPTETDTPTPTRTAVPVILETWTPSLPGAPGWYGVGACALAEQTAPIGGNPLAWPADSHYLSGYAYSGWHPAIDVAATYGAPIYATDSGVVVYSGWNDTGYGTFLIIDHGDGLWSAYAHLSQTLVGCLQPVVQGQLIGTAGATGYAQGVHLHFELYQSGVGQVNPWSRLP